MPKDRTEGDQRPVRVNSRKVFLGHSTATRVDDVRSADAGKKAGMTVHRDAFVSNTATPVVSARYKLNLLHECNLLSNC